MHKPRFRARPASWPLWISLLGGIWLGCAHRTPTTAASAPAVDSPAALTTVALRVHRLEAMVEFYSEAFGASFREVDTSGLRSQFGRLGDLTLKLVPLRESVDFEDYPSHQLGFEVDDVEAVIALAEKHGGRREGELRRADGRLHGAVRDPDGNTIELYGPP